MDHTEHRREIKRRAQAKWREANPERHRETVRAVRLTYWAEEILKSCKGSAKRRGHECLLTLEDVRELFTGMTCSVTGVPLQLEWTGGGSKNPWYPSVDRLDCAKGYTRDNVRAVCWAFNQARGDWPDEVVEQWVKAWAPRLN
jgi:hypothetical protein